LKDSAWTYGLVYSFTVLATPGSSESTFTSIPLPRRVLAHHNGVVKRPFEEITRYQ
jgi:hypothetical protein